MPKQEIKRPHGIHTGPENEHLSVFEIQSTEKAENESSLTEDITAAPDKVFPIKPSISDSPIPPIYGAIDTDLGRDNLEINLPRADIADL